MVILLRIDKSQTYTPCTSMAPRWLYEIGGRSLFVTSEFMDRLKNGDAAALRALQKVDLTTLYRRTYSRRTKREFPGLFWSDEPELGRIPVVRGGRHAPGPWIPDFVEIHDRPTTEQQLSKLFRLANDRRKSLKPKKVVRRRKPPATAEALFQALNEERLIEAWLPKEPRVKPPDSDLLITCEPVPQRWIPKKPGVSGRYEKAGWEFKALRMKVNPKFELVVVNKHDRAALLKLLNEIDLSPTVEAWLDDRTMRSGATLSSALHADYEKWCSANGEAALGSKAFAQALVANGVVKLTRRKQGERYELELRAAPRSADTSRD